MPNRLSRRLGIAALLAAVVAPPAFAQFKLGGSSTGAAPAPGAPAAAAAPAVEDPKATKLLDFLEKEYGALFAKSKDRVAKSLMAVCLNRLPRNGPTKALLEMAKKEADPLVRAVAWECLLSRAPSLGMDQYGQLMDVTYSLAQTDTLRGQLRVGALELLAVSPPTRKNKELLTQIYARCDSRNPADDDVIDGVGKVVGIWRSADLVEHFIGRLTTLDEAFRAYRVLYAAGSPVTPDKIQMDLGDRKCIAALQADHVAWWNADKAKWVESKVSLEDAPWRQLVPHLISAPMPLASVNADDKSWRRDLELRRPSLKSFDVNFLV
ncbi:MAG TPA: hypothetical protein VK986_00735, partial [Tepidisphaeraceae bacterium]|nr:hypothetical protein [Tepidisphaeraceae bacterium]